MNLFTKQKQTHRHRKQSYGYQSGKGCRDKLGVGIHTTIYKIDKQQGPTAVIYRMVQYSQINVIPHINK